MALEPLQTAEGHDSPTVRQLAVFLENRVGQMARLTRLLERTEVHILAISIVNAGDCAIIRMIVDQPDEADALFRANGFALTQSELIVVSLPPGKRALLHIWLALMAGEIDVAYAYPLLIQPHGAPAIALQTDNLDMAANVLRNEKFDVLSQADLLKGGA